MKLFKRPKDMLAEPLEQGIEQEVARRVTDADFVPAPYNPDEGERGGYSNYSYWGSTFRSFLKDRIALGFLLTLVVLLLFTFIQPMLPQQFEANVIIDHPLTKRQMSNVAPGWTNIAAEAPMGTELVVHEYDNDEWAAISAPP